VACDPFNLVLVDLGIGVKQAYRLPRMIGNSAAMGRPKFVLLSSSAQAGIAEEALENGYSYYLEKPIRQSKLFDCLVTVLKAGVAIEESTSAIEKSMVESNFGNGERGTGDLILVAEDNPVNQKVVLLLLRELGYAGHAVANGKEAVESLARTNYALVLMDCQMPEMDGFEATRRIRRMESETDNHTPIVALTAHAMSEDRDRCLTAGMDDYIAKPISAKKLGEVIERWLRVKKEWQATSEPVSKSRTSKSPVDLDLFLATYGEKAGGELLKDCLDSIHTLSKKISTAISERQAPALRFATHQLKGTSASAYAPEMARLCRELEDAATNEDWPAIATLHEALRSECAKVEDLLETKLRS
jgi:CheY-like chemotaxis protein/HPt (histidine-containing phosphotransfer) domain-containing protein